MVGFDALRNSVSTSCEATLALALPVATDAVVVAARSPPANIEDVVEVISTATIAVAAAQVTNPWAVSRKKTSWRCVATER